MCDENKPDSTSCEEDSKPEKMEVDETADSIEQSNSSKSESKGSPSVKDEMDVKSPSSPELKAEPEDEAEEPDGNTENTTPGQKRRGRPPKPGNERKRRPRAKDVNAPKAPINGYVRFLNENRERCRKVNPEVAFANITKLLAQEWSQLKQEDKQKYLDAAEKDRERYMKEVEEYQQTDCYKQFRKHIEEEEAAKQKAIQEAKESEKKKSKASEKQLKMSANNTLRTTNNKMDEVPPSVTPPQVVHQSNIRHNPDDTFDIPIFTEEFLDHNKTREAEMRHLRKHNTDLEEHNSVLVKHIDSFKDAIGKLESEAEQHRNSNKQLEMYLAKLRTRLVDTFQEISIPGWQMKLSVENVDHFMEHIFQFVQSCPKDNDKTVQTIRNVVNRLDCTDL
ncbi:high mobility group protein 20A [Galendromus occidentalis]|uniref:High mobility group protein 20A n=1 Tax=Galendromus occidentalis TaxID=34638 RepID=A0AAJ7PAV8_9ACAR|nr:high mobility group protein 20A [Galendromus occidentalis]